MKKLLAVFALLTVLGLNSYASPFKLSLFGDIAVPQTEQANVVLGLIDNHTPTVKGVDLNFISARADELYLEGGMATHSSTLAWKIPTDRGAWRAGHD